MHDPATAPDRWLELTESERHEQTVTWHDNNPNPVIHARTPDDMHARMHVAVEDQVATNEPPVARRTLDRLTHEGLNRHVAVHALIDVFIRQMVATMASATPFDNAAYATQLDALSGADLIARRLGR